MIAVVVSTRHAGFGAAFLPPTALVARGGGREYHFYTTGAAVDTQYTDPADGEVLLEIRSFPDEEAARQWVELDIDWRAAQ